MSNKEINDLLKKGNTLYSLNYFKEAIECYDKAIEINPKFNEAYNNKGNTLYRLNYFKEAIECYDKAIEINPESSEAYYNKGVILSYIGRFEEAIECYNEIINNKKYYYFSYRLFFSFQKLYKYMCEMNREEEYNNTINKIIQNDFSVQTEYKAIENKEYKLYKYTKIDTYSIDTILNDKLWLSSPNTFNDPIDPPIKLLNERNDNQFKCFIDSIFIGCLSLTKDNTLMWSHYANKHEGICIEYDFSNFFKNDSLENIYKDTILKKIDYVENIIIQEDGLISTSKSNAKNSENGLVDILTIKSMEWKYENEYRVIKYCSNVENTAQYIDLPIKSIYFGTKAKEENINLLNQILANRKDIKLYKAKFNNNIINKIDFEEI